MGRPSNEIEENVARFNLKNEERKIEAEKKKDLAETRRANLNLILSAIAALAAVVAAVTTVIGMFR